MQMFYSYVYELPTFVDETVHQPLISITKKKLNEVSPGTRQVIMNLQRYDFDLIYTPGKHIDAISKLPLIVCVSSSHEDALALVKNDHCHPASMRLYAKLNYIRDN